MNEHLLSFIWKYRLYSPDLKTTCGEPVSVIKPGEQNTNAGPDFFNARLKIGETLWAGNVEIHVKSSDWHRHHHHDDKAYNNVILHVVFEADREISTVNNTLIPTLALVDFADEVVLRQYRHLRTSRQPIPCGKQILQVDALTTQLWIDRMLVERLEYKSLLVENALQTNKGDWEDAFYQLLARNFGFHVNAGPFEMLARSLPLRLLLKHRDQPHQVEALLYGQAGMLNEKFDDDYPRLLATEYSFLSKKYGLVPLDKHIWKLLRMRPANFPVIRIAQFASIIIANSLSLAAVCRVEAVDDFRKMFDATTSPYWDTHYLFDKTAPYQPRKMGESSVNNILTNTIAPFLFYYGKLNNEEQFCDKAFHLLQSLPAEKNHILDAYTACGLIPANAFMAQSLLGMYQNYCSQKKCLNCSLGTTILKLTDGIVSR